MLLTVIAITVMMNILESSEARGRGRTSLEQMPRNAATLLTGAVGMLLLFTYLFETISSSSRISPTASLYVYALSSTVLLMEACCLLPPVIRHHVPIGRGKGFPEGIAAAQPPPGAGPVGDAAAGPGRKGGMKRMKRWWEHNDRTHRRRRQPGKMDHPTGNPSAQQPCSMAPVDEKTTTVVQTSTPRYAPPSR